MALVRLAGGILWREDAAGRRLAVIHRPRQRDWSLPKGRLDGGESWEEAALREVREETGCEARLLSFAGAAAYVPRRTPRLALYWHLELVREGQPHSEDEVDEVLWLPPAEAIARLDHEPERRLVERAPSPSGARGAKARPAGTLAAEVAEARAELLRRALALDERADGSGLGAALALLDQAEDALAHDRGAESAARLIAAGRRLGLLGLQEPELSLRARALREEAGGHPPPRRRAVRSLLPSGERPTPEAVFLARELLDEARPRAAPARPRWTAAVGLACALAAALALVLAGAPQPALLGAVCGALAGAAAALLLRPGSAR